MRIAVTVLCIVRQPRESNECGLHVLLFAIWLRAAPNTLPIAQPSTPPCISLKAWRKRLATFEYDADLPGLFEEQPYTNCATPYASPRPPSRLDLRTILSSNV
eukprot:PhM_4_TR18007/c0_g1_i7/m.89091